MFVWTIQPKRFFFKVGGSSRPQINQNAENKRSFTHAMVTDMQWNLLSKCCTDWNSIVDLDLSESLVMVAEDVKTERTAIFLGYREGAGKALYCISAVYLAPMLFPPEKPVSCQETDTSSETSLAALLCDSLSNDKHFTCYHNISQRHFADHRIWEPQSEMEKSARLLFWCAKANVVCWQGRLREVERRSTAMLKSDHWISLFYYNYCLFCLFTNFLNFTHCTADVLERPQKHVKPVGGDNVSPQEAETLLNPSHFLF